MCMKQLNRGYIELCWHVDGGEDIYLRVPTIYDPINKVWRAFIKTCNTKKLIHGEGKDSRELEASFLVSLSSVFNQGGEVADEVIAMMMPAWYWEKEK